MKLVQGHVQRSRLLGSNKLSGSLLPLNGLRECGLSCERYAKKACYMDV